MLRRDYICDNLFMTKRGIILMNLGSPDSTRVKDVRSYLNEFLMDGRVIDYPWLFRFLLVRGIITPFRAPKSAEAYKTIWTEQGSPLIVLTKKLQAALQLLVDMPVEVAMRYGNPDPKSAYENLIRKVNGLEEVILVPLYPHYAMSSYETAIEYMKVVHRKNKYGFRLKTIKPYYNDPAYINALAESMKPYLQHEFDHMLLSYHGVPERHILKGDVTGKHCLQSENCCEVNSPAHQYCYRHQCRVTTRLVAQKLNLPMEKFSMSFQSRLGRSEWLKPYTAVRLQELPNQGKKKILVACPAFVSDCLETLEEIAEQGKESFMHAGGEKFTMIPCMNDNPAWVNTISNWVREIADGEQQMLLSTKP
jgi:protoporphyrin/coproporphyrin ferrochelatase